MMRLVPKAQSKLIEYVELFQGSVESAAVYGRELAKWVLLTRASAVVLAHNHPSGDPNPSSADICLTGRLKQTLDNIEVKLLLRTRVTPPAPAMALRIEPS